MSGSATETRVTRAGDVITNDRPSSRCSDSEGSDAVPLCANPSFIADAVGTGATAARGVTAPTGVDVAGAGIRLGVASPAGVAVFAVASFAFSLTVGCQTGSIAFRDVGTITAAVCTCCPCAIRHKASTGASGKKYFRLRETPRELFGELAFVFFMFGTPYCAGKVWLSLLFPRITSTT